MDSKRERAMSQKGREYYDSLVGEYWRKLSSVKKAIDVILSEDFAEGSSLTDIRDGIEKHFKKYSKLSCEFSEFLERCGTQESLAELVSHKLIFDTVQSKVHTVLQNIAAVELAVGSPYRTCEAVAESAPEAKKDDKPLKSAKSGCGSKGSKLSCSSSFLMKKKAKAEAAKARLMFAEKEAQLKREQAKREEMLRREQAECAVNLDILAHQKALAEAEAELSVAEEVAHESKASLPASVADKDERTRQYVQQQSRYLQSRSNQNVPEPNRVQVQPEVALECSVLNVQAPEFVLNLQEQHVQELTSDFTRFLLKKDLLLLKLTNFNDDPSCYHSWKQSFLDVVREHQATPTEQLDLLAKWLGPELKKHAVSTRSSSCGNPSKGLERLWNRLDERYGSPETVEACVRTKLAKFGKVGRDNRRLFELCDILFEIEALKEDSRYRRVLAYFDSTTGVNPIIQKLPISLQSKWTDKASHYKKQHRVSFPPFTFLVEFIQGVSSTLNDPSFNYDGGAYSKDTVSQSLHTTPYNRFTSRSAVTARKTEIDGYSQYSQTYSPATQSRNVPYCPFHKAYHSVNKCRGFKQLSYNDRKDIILNSNFCFRCCESDRHIARYCKSVIKCTECGSIRHCTAMHIYQNQSKPGILETQAASGHGGEPQRKGMNVASKCSQVCGERFPGKSCAKTVLTKVYPKDHPEIGVPVYVIIDDQSNRTLAKSKLLDMLNTDLIQTLSYSLSSCNGVIETSGRLGTGLIVESLNGDTRFELPPVIECDQIPNVMEEIPSPEVVQYQPHLKHLVNHIPPLHENAEIMLLIGRDLPDVHHVLEQCTGTAGSPFAQRLPLGWVVVGDVCLGDVHTPQLINVNKTSVLMNGRPTLLQPCVNNLHLKEMDSVDELCPDHTSNSIGLAVFQRTKDDDKAGLSTEDRLFLQLVDKHFVKDEKGNWTAPLPFKPQRQRLPNNRTQALKRAKLLDMNLKKNPQKKSDCVEFMSDIFEMGHAEKAPSISTVDECWYLPLFGLYHPKKPTQLRGVFDSSAIFEGISLNKVLMTGPDLINNLVGILLRFRKAPVAVTADIQKMFYCFYVTKEHRRYLRFFWYEDNNPENELVEYQMCVHVFGNSPSPAVATYGLRKAVETCEDEYGPDVKELVEKHFYVDDLLVSLETEDQTVSLIKRTQQALMREGNIRLHKIASNRKGVITAFPQEDLSKDLKMLNIASDLLPLHRSLGLSWNLNLDTFVFVIQDSQIEKPFTRRGLLSVINSLFDPLGFLAPVTVQGKILLKELATKGIDWDEELSDVRRCEWESWIHSLNSTEDVVIPRTFVPISVDKAVSCQIHIFSDASEKAIASVAFLKTVDNCGTRHVGFIIGKAKVAPSHGNTIPRLELCAAVLSVELAEFLQEHLDIRCDTVKFYTDSKVVLGYIRNQTRRFYTYVSNRVDKIKRYSNPEQWNYVPTHLNPADEGTRSVPNVDLNTSMWLSGPPQLLKQTSVSNESDYSLVDPESDKEIKPDVHVIKTEVSCESLLGVNRFEKFSSWKKLVKAVSALKKFARLYHKPLSDASDVQIRVESESFIMKEIQRESYSAEIKCLEKGEPVSQHSHIVKLNPFLDENGLLHVGGRLSKSDLTSEEKHPWIVSGKSHVAKLLVSYHHEAVKHQGRSFTEGAVRASGLWITGAKRLISSVLHKCVQCRKLRRPLENQKMADLPLDRLVPGPPFTSVGVDTFGPWSIVVRKTRGGQANSKRWAILFSCLTTRAIHIEVVEELSSSSFINALKTFAALRGKVSLF